MAKPVKVDYPTEVETAYEESESVVSVDEIQPEPIVLNAADVYAARELTIYPRAKENYPEETNQRLVHLGLAVEIDGGYVRGPEWNKVIGR